MQTVVGVSFKKAGKIYYFDPSDIELRYEDKVIVETSRGVELGEVVINPREVEDDQIVQPLKKVIRKATPKDLEQLEINQHKEKDAYGICLEKIGNHGLPMKLVDVEYTFDNNKIIFYFTADGRVDFRELVKDLASVFRTRIELRQIGVRDEAKMIGGLGPCGLELCCKTFLREFEPISIKMAKSQELSLNPAKISGICGRLMCCLRYECDTYDDDLTDDDIIIDDQGEVIKLGDELDIIDEYEKYSGFAKKYAKAPQVIDDEQEENKFNQGSEKTDDMKIANEDVVKGERTDKDDKSPQTEAQVSGKSCQQGEQQEQKKKPYYGKNKYRNSNYNYNNTFNDNNTTNPTNTTSYNNHHNYREKNNFHNNQNNYPNSNQDQGGCGNKSNNNYHTSRKPYGGDQEPK